MNVNNILSGSLNNNIVNSIDKMLFAHKPGKLIISPDNSTKATAISITSDGITINNNKITSGLSIGDLISIQGVTFNSSKGSNLKKGEYSENPKSSKIFTYKETVLLESIPQELAANVSEKLGVKITMDGSLNIMTDISAGPLPHFHSISMKHVHRLEPAYLYRYPSIINSFKGALQTLTQFFAL